jgi:hypothetical protein
MSAGTAAVPSEQASMEQKIEDAAAKASEIVSAFSPAAGTLIQMGVEVEPVISSLVKLFAHFFQHHLKKSTAAPAPAAGAQPGA